MTKPRLPLWQGRKWRPMTQCKLTRPNSTRHRKTESCYRRRFRPLLCKPVSWLRVCPKTYALCMTKPPAKLPCPSAQLGWNKTRSTILLWKYWLIMEILARGLPASKDESQLRKLSYIPHGAALGTVATGLASAAGRELRQSSRSSPSPFSHSGRRGICKITRSEK